MHAAAARKPDATTWVALEIHYVYTLPFGPSTYLAEIAISRGCSPLVFWGKV
jgi:hypothetical protein